MDTRWRAVTSFPGTVETREVRLFPTGCISSGSRRAARPTPRRSWWFDERSQRRHRRRSRNRDSCDQLREEPPQCGNRGGIASEPYPPVGLREEDDRANPKRHHRRSSGPQSIDDDCVSMTTKVSAAE